MKSRMAKSKTADLFGVSSAVQVGQTADLVFGMPPATRSADRPRSKQLWYAVVFPELAKEHSPAALQRLCMYAQQFTSFVSIEPPNALLLEIKGSLQLFGPLERMHADIDACWRRLALPARSASAPTTLAALWLARGRQPCAVTPAADAAPLHIEDLATLPGHLTGLPIACTAWDIAWLQTLRAMGVTRIGELLRLPRAGLARRLGAAAVQDLDIALARQFAPRRAFVPRERFRERCDFETEIENVAYLEKALEPLIARCAQFLRERQAGVQALRLSLRHRAGPATCVHLGLASITSERRRLMDVLTQKLTRLELPAPVRGMELISGALLPLSAGSLDAFAGLACAGSGSGGRDSVPQLVERLRARLGEEAVYGIASIAEHRPEAAWRRVHELPLTSVSRGGEKTIDRGLGDGMPRPVWLLDEPRPLASGLVLEHGPERIESGWWDGKDVARDYYIARQASDARRSHRAKLWVFQERQSKCWYLHGMFA
ncbi:MAG TPA: DNA polymerase Y family protein [Steroidobacteraceae bacterium]|jgi:protein ImuB|nr:DNA polymerase Y family protein [Steroidobacteraceae bacterium]